MNAKDLWNDLFDISLEKYRTEDCNIRNMAMLLHVFRLEFQKVTNSINELQQKNEIQSTTIKNYEHDLKNCNCKVNARSPLKTLENKSLSPKINQSPKKINLSNVSPKNVIKSNISPKKVNVTPKKINESITSVDHFDIFNDHISEEDANISKENDASLFVDDSFSSVTTPTITSPTLNHRKSRSFRVTSKNQNLNNSSVIQGTPTLSVNKVKKFKQSKLPLSFCPTPKNRNDTDATFCFINQEINNENSTGDDIDALLDEINCVTPTSKRTKFLDNSYDRPPSTHDRPKFAFKRDIVRKKNERLQMQGWDCPDCEKYFGALNLPEDELKKRMNKCSKHRDNFNPIRLTPDGFWNPDFTPTQNSFAFEL